MSRENQVPIWLIALLLAAGGTPTFAQVDFTGEWRSLIHEDGPHRGAGPEIGDYTGLPINAAARLRADSWDASRLTLPEEQCLPQPAPYAERGASNAQIRWWKTIDPATQQLIAYQKRGSWMEPERTIWLDGRPHPSENAAHTWQGFSTGKWEGNTLTVTTTHIKEGFIQRNGVAHSDRTVMTEHWVRHGNYLTAVLIVEDPVYLSEPFVRTSTWVLDTHLQLARYPCGANEIVVEVPRPKGSVPHHLPGTNTSLTEFATKYGLPFEATKGGSETLYPEYMERLKSMKTAKTGIPSAAK
jgi:hypothetical protein